MMEGYGHEEVSANLFRETPWQESDQKKYSADMNV